METITKAQTQTSNVIYTAKTRTTGGRGLGKGRSSDGLLDVSLSTPGTNGTGTNPEQLFAVGWSACFEAAMSSVARAMRVKLPDETAIDAEVDLCVDNGNYYLQARLNISVPGVDKEIAKEIIHGAHLTCPYSKAVNGNIKVEYNLV